MDRDENPLVYDTLNALPIHFCDCDHPDLFDTEYNKSELREVYYLATEPIARKGDEVSIAISETMLSELRWVVLQEDGMYMTSRGRKLFPLLLTVANELQA